MLHASSDSHAVGNLTIVHIFDTRIGQAYFAMAKGDAAQSLGELGRWLEDSTALLLRSNLDGASVLDIPSSNLQSA